MKNIITISREYGSGGYEIGQKAADALGFKFYDKELIAQIAEKLLVSESFMRSTEDKLIRRNIFRETFPILSNGENQDADFVFAQQGKFIVELAEKVNGYILFHTLLILIRPVFDFNTPTVWAISVHA